MQNDANTARSLKMKQIWENERERMMEPREAQLEKIKKAQSELMKKHFLEHPEHRVSISNAQKAKWVKYKKAVAYCEQNHVNLDAVVE